jgi:hypothetical protein
MSRSNQIEGFGPLDDESLARLASPGALRRAASMVAEPLSSENPSEFRFLVQGQTVIIGKGGIPSARCSCPAGGSGTPCVHALAVALLLRQSEAGTGAEAAAVDAKVSEAGGSASVDLKTRDSEEQSSGVSSVPTEDYSLLFEQIEDALEETMETGLAHIGNRGADRFSSLARSATDLYLYRIAWALREAAGEATALSERLPDADAAALLMTMARILALLESTKSLGLGSRMRRDYRKAATLRALPLGAYWWESKNGARGMTFALWDTESSGIRSATLARPDSRDLSFDRNRAWSTLPLWSGGSCADRLCSGFLTVEGLRLSEDGRYATGGSARVEISRAPHIEELPAMGYFDWPVFLASVAEENAIPYSDKLFLLRPSANGKFGFDEVEQTFLWAPRDRAGRQLVLELPYTSSTAKRTESLVALLESGQKIQGILVSRKRIARRTRILPLAVLLEEGDCFRPVSLDFEAPIEMGPSVLELLMKKKISPMRMIASENPIARIANPALGILESISETGRPMIGDVELRSTLEKCASKLEDVGLAVLATAIRNSQKALLSSIFLRPRLSMLKLVFLLDRAEATFETLVQRDTADE